MTDWNLGTTVLMSVPLKWAHRVMEFLADLEAGRAGVAEDAEQPASESVHVDDEGAWTAEMVVTLAENLPYRGAAALLGQCADRPGEWVPKADAEAAEGISAIQLRNELVALSKLTNRLFERNTWPIVTKKELGSYYYRMDPRIAGWWRDARSQNAGGVRRDGA